MIAFSLHYKKSLAFRLVLPLLLGVCLIKASQALAASAEKPAAPNTPKTAADIAVKGDASFAALSEKARAAAAGGFEHPGRAPKFFTGLKMEDWQKIGFKPEFRPWKLSQGGGFNVDLYHPGFVYNRTVSFYLLEKGAPKRLPFSEQMFDYSALGASAENLAESPGDFAGFSLIQTSAGKDERCLAVFLGASFFQARGARGDFGLLARGLSIDAAMPGGEQFPYFREFWLQPPGKNAKNFTLYALLDSPGAAGAYRFVITPGSTVIMDVVCKLYPRAGNSGALKMGIAPINGMFLSSETFGSPVPDYRPEAHSIDGLLYTDGGNNWTWRPLNNPLRMAIQTVPARNPRGFGLMQRDANFDHYQDLSARFERHSSLWVEPAGDWGEGSLELIELPTKTDINRNVHASWVPAGPLPAETAFAYRLYWMNPGATPHKLGRVASTRVVRDRGENTARFIIDFEGGGLEKLPADTGLSSVVETPENSPLLEKRLFKNEVTGGWRLDFKVRLPENKGMVQSLIATGENIPPLWFNAVLKKGENLPDPLSETWNYPLHHME